MASRVHKKTSFSERLDDISYAAILCIWAATILIFAIIYALLAHFPGSGQVTSYTLKPIQDFWSTVYFSVITATGTGYGDVVPLGFSRVFASFESFGGLILLAVFVTKLLSHRQDIALKEVHEISFQTALHNMREDLYVARKDLDMGITAAQNRHALTEPEWAQITVAFQQIGHLLQEIPDFYPEGHNLYAIDERREHLLIEAVVRTFFRILKLLEALKENKIDLDDGKEIGIELNQMLMTTASVLSVWETYAPRRKDEQLRSIQNIVLRIKTLLEH